MFVSKKDFEWLNQKVDALSKTKTCNIAPRIESCEKCGCLIWQTEYNKGKPEIKQIESRTFWSSVKENYIYYPYYCKAHMPKEKK